MSRVHATCRACFDTIEEGDEYHKEGSPGFYHKKCLSQVKTPIVAIIGSSRFKKLHLGHAQRLTLQGKIVLSRGFYHHVDNAPITTDQLKMLDALLLARIALADEVFVVSVNGYIGESTARAIAFAKTSNKPITFSDDESREVEQP